MFTGDPVEYARVVNYKSQELTLRNVRGYMYFFKRNIMRFLLTIVTFQLMCTLLTREWDHYCEYVKFCLRNLQRFSGNPRVRLLIYKGLSIISFNF